MNNNLTASVRARLLNIAKAEKSNFNQLLIRYALERFLYRLSQSHYAERFLLKGALLFTLWYNLPHRPTRDIDLLGFGSSELENISLTFREIAAITAVDGIVFDPNNRATSIALLLGISFCDALLIVRKSIVITVISSCNSAVLLLFSPF